MTSLSFLSLYQAFIAPVPPERNAARDEAVLKLSMSGIEGAWSLPGLRKAAGEDADLLFPSGVAEMSEYYSDLADRLMVSGAFLSQTSRLSQKVRALILVRLEQARPQKSSVEAAMRVLMQPANACRFRRAMWRTVDAIWEAVGDESTGMTYFTKRASLSAVYASVLLYWLNHSDDAQAVAEFLDRRLAGVAGIGRAKAKLKARLGCPRISRMTQPN